MIYEKSSRQGRSNFYSIKALQIWNEYYGSNQLRENP